MHDRSPKITVIMSAFNESDGIGRAIDSILGQTFSYWELLIVDDASTDNTKSIIKEYCEIDSRIMLIENSKNIGLPASLNKAIKLSKTNFIARADADDINMPLRLEKQYNYISKRANVDVLGTGAFLVKKQDNCNNKPYFLDAKIPCFKISLISSYFFHPSVIIRRSFFEKVGLYDEGLLLAQDLDLWIRGAKLGSGYYNLQEPLIKYTVGDHDRSYKYLITKMKVLLKISKKHKINFRRVTVYVLFIRSILVILNIYMPKSTKV